MPRVPSAPTPRCGAQPAASDPCGPRRPERSETMNHQVGNRLQRVEALAVVPDMRGRVVLVTGASDGVGRSVAAQLAATGAVTLITARNRAKGERVRDEIVQTTGNEDVHGVDLDLADLG